MRRVSNNTSEAGLLLYGSRQACLVKANGGSIRKQIPTSSYSFAPLHRGGVLQEMPHQYAMVTPGCRYPGVEMLLGPGRSLVPYLGPDQNLADAIRPLSKVLPGQSSVVSPCMVMMGGLLRIAARCSAGGWRPGSTDGVGALAGQNCTLRIACVRGTFY
jgi:hypothetical protein